MFFSGCISGDNEETVAPTTTVPPNVDTTPILASELQARLVEYQERYTKESEQVQAMLDELQAMIQESSPEYEAINVAYGRYQTVMLQYVRMSLRPYYKAKILLEHTTQTKDGQLKIRKDTLPFSPGKQYCYENVSLMGESFNVIFPFQIGQIIDEGLDGQDVREELIDAFERLENTAEKYLDAEIGYVYYYLSEVLVRQSLYSDILIRDCNPYCIY